MFKIKWLKTRLDGRNGIKYNFFMNILKSVRFSEKLNIEKGLTAIIGSGGKTTLLHTLASELQGTVILTTTTHMYPAKGFVTLISPSEQQLALALQETRVVCVGNPAESGKITAPALDFRRLTQMADYVLVEADGAKRLPLKAHAAHEPIIPTGANQTICVVGASGFNQPIDTVVHRPQRFAELVNARVTDSATPERVAKAIQAEGWVTKIFVNQCDTLILAKQAQKMTDILSVPVILGSLKYKICYE